jgi:hypothetical protein
MLYLRSIDGAVFRKVSMFSISNLGFCEFEEIDRGDRWEYGEKIVWRLQFRIL